jgi:hypothetical protein
MPKPNFINKQFDKTVADQVFGKDKGKSGLSRLEKMFILRTMYERWDIAYAARKIHRGSSTLSKYKREIYEDPRRIFIIDGLYHKLESIGRKRAVFSCSLCEEVLRTTEEKMRRHFATHVVPADVLSNVHF